MMNKIKKFLQSPHHFALVFAILYFLIGFILVFTHEQIFDEVNPWQIAKSITPENFFEVMRVEPHPPLWYFILLPFVKLGLPLITTNFISLSIMALTVYLFLRFAPFRRGTKLACLLSVAFFYFFPVISRDYCLVPLALTLITIAYPTRLEHPLRYGLTLVLLAQSHFLMLSLAGILTLFFIYDYLKNRRQKNRTTLHLAPFCVSIFLIILSALSSIPSILGTLDSHRLIRRSDDFSYALINPDKIGTAPEHRYEKSLSYTEYSGEINSSLFFIFLPVFEIFAVAIIIYLIINYRRLAVCFTVFLATFFIITFFVYLNFRNLTLKTATIISVMIFIYWLTFLEKPRPLPRAQKFFHKIELIRYLSVKKYLAPALFVTPVLCTIPFTVASAVKDITAQCEDAVNPAVVNQLNSTEDDAVIVVEGQPYVRSAFYVYTASLTGRRMLYDDYYKRPMDYVAYDNSEIEFAGYERLHDLFAELAEKYHTRNIYHVTIQGESSCGGPTHVPYDDTWEYAFTIEPQNGNTRSLDVFKINLDKY